MIGLLAFLAVWLLPGLALISPYYFGMMYERNTEEPANGYYVGASIPLMLFGICWLTMLGWAVALVVVLSP